MDSSTMAGDVAEEAQLPMLALSYETEGQETIDAEDIADPLEPWNRFVFQFNDDFYIYVFKPVAQGYNWLVPRPVRSSIRNLFHNLMMPVRFVNDLLQLKFESAAIEIARFGVNTTAGVAGFFDIASDYLNLKSPDEDFGQSLGFYGMPHCLYVVWPFIGPSSLRDTLGLAGDSFLDPVNYLVPGAEWIFATHAYQYFNDGSLRLGDYEDWKKSAIDPYTSQRDAYYQYRKRQVEQ